MPMMLVLHGGDGTAKMIWRRWYGGDGTAEMVWRRFYGGDGIVRRGLKYD